MCNMDNKDILNEEASLFEGSEAARAAMNDSPVDCQNREWTEPQRDSSRVAGDEV